MVLGQKKRGNLAVAILVLVLVFVLIFLLGSHPISCAHWTTPKPGAQPDTHKPQQG